MNKIKAVKLANKIVVGVSVGYVVSSALANNANVDTLPRQVQVTIGAFVVGALVSELATRYVDNQIDEIVNALKSSQTS